MAESQERIVREFCAAWGDGTDRAPDVDAIVEMFAEDGAWHVSMPKGPVIRGRAAIRAEIERQTKFATRMQCGIDRIISHGSTVMTERLDHFTMHDVRVAHALVAVYDLDDSGRIVSWREYFDTADIGEQLGMKPDQVMNG